MASKWTKIGSVRQNDKGGHYIQLEEGVEITLNGNKVNPSLGKSGKASLTMQDPRENLQRLLDNGHAKDVAKTEAQLENLKTKAKFVKFDIFSTGN